MIPETDIPGDTRNEVPAEVIADNLDLTLRLIGEYERPSSCVQPCSLEGRVADHRFRTVPELELMEIARASVPDDPGTT